MSPSRIRKEYVREVSVRGQSWSDARQADARSDARDKLCPRKTARGHGRIGENPARVLCENRLVRGFARTGRGCLCENRRWMRAVRKRARASENYREPPRMRDQIREIRAESEIFRKLSGFFKKIDFFNVLIPIFVIINS